MKRFLIGIIFVSMIAVSLSFVSETHAKDPIVLKMTTFLPKGDPTMTAWLALIDDINAKAKGELIIKYVGGPEAIPGFKQFEAVKKGIVDMIFSAESYYGAEVTKAAYTHLSRLSPQEERKKGYYDYRVELLKKHNVFYLGRAAHHIWFQVYTNKVVKRPQELKGQKLWVSATYEPFIKAIGAVPITMPGGEVYTALERGVIDGYAWAITGNVGFGWPEVCKYILEPRIYEMNVEGLINLNTWNKLPPHLQKLIMEAMINNEIQYGPIMAAAGEKEYKEMQAKGMKVIKFSPEDTKWYVDLAYKAGWDEVIKRSPEIGPKLKQLLSP
jgi:TRAP-type C4-dicarboxylate transport system substrate-binding protein